MLIVNSPSFGAVSLSLAWTNEGAFVFADHQPPAYLVPLGDGCSYRESWWGIALAVSLPDGVHLFDSTEVQITIHAAGVELAVRESVDFVADVFLRGLASLGVDGVRQTAAAWTAACSSKGGHPVPEPQWRKEMRRVWGTRKHHDRACFAKCTLLDAVMGRG